MERNKKLIVIAVIALAVMLTAILFPLLLFRMVLRPTLTPSPVILELGDLPNEIGVRYFNNVAVLSLPAKFKLFFKLELDVKGGTIGSVVVAIYPEGKDVHVSGFTLSPFKTERSIILEKGTYEFHTVQVAWREPASNVTAIIKLTRWQFIAL